MNGTASCSLKVFLFLVISCNINHFHHTIKWYMFPSLYICSSPSCAWHISAHSCLKFDTNGGSSACRIWEHHLFFEISFLKITVYFKNIFCGHITIVPKTEKRWWKLIFYKGPNGKNGKGKKYFLWAQESTVEICVLSKDSLCIWSCTIILLFVKIKFMEFCLMFWHNNIKLYDTRII